MTTQPLMPKATAIWLIENTSLTFEQIADFCQLHILEIEAIADGESTTMAGFDPIASSQLTHEEIKRCEADPSARLLIRPAIDVETLIQTNRAKYTPIAKRKNKPNAILWIQRYYPQIPDAGICQLLGVTPSMVRAVRLKSTPRYENLEACDPVKYGFCSQKDLDVWKPSTEQE